MAGDAKPSNDGICLVKSFLKSYNFQEKKPNSTISCDTYRGDKTISNIFGVAMYAKLINRMILSTQEKSSSIATLRYSYPQIEPSSEITENSQETIHDPATFLRLVLVMDNLF